MRSAMLEELALSERIVRDGHEVVPRVRVIAPEGQCRPDMVPQSPAITPPSIRNWAPVTMADSSEHRYTAMCATSSGRIMRPIG